MSVAVQTEVAISTTAAVLAAPGRFEEREVTIAAPRRGEIAVAIEGSGICASSQPVWEGREWFQYPLDPGVPGHEGWGRVESVGDGVDLEPGQRVAFLSDRAFARHAVVPASAALVIPDSLAAVPMPAEALACAVNIARRSDLQQGQTVAIIGIGFLGALACRLAKNAGARVIAISRRPFALELAKRFGADETIPMNDHWEILREAAQLTEQRGCDRVIEAVGMQWPLDLAGELVREGGRLVIAGYHQDGPRQVNMQQWNWKGIDVINAHERDQSVVLEGMRMAIAAVADGTLDPSPLYTHNVSIATLGDAFGLMRERPDGFVKALLVNA